MNKRQIRKCWDVMFVCTTTFAIHVEFVKPYSTDSFLMAFSQFMSERVHSDRGDQLMAASKQTEQWDFEGTMSW